MQIRFKFGRLSLILATHTNFKQNGVDKVPELNTACSTKTILKLKPTLTQFMHLYLIVRFIYLLFIKQRGIMFFFSPLSLTQMKALFCLPRDLQLKLINFI